MPESPALNEVMAILGRLIGPDRPGLTPEAAHAILAIDFEPEDRDRMNALAARAREGRLSVAEDRELEAYLQVGRLLALMQSKARKSLAIAGARS